MGFSAGRMIYAGCGIVCTLLAFAGVVVPGLPTTPLVLLASWLFMRSSPSLHRRLRSLPVIGKHIARYEAGEGMSPRMKAWAIAVMSAMIALSCFTVFTSLLARHLVITAGVAGAVAMLAWGGRRRPCAGK